MYAKSESSLSTSQLTHTNYFSLILTLSNLSPYKFHILTSIHTLLMCVYFLHNVHERKCQTYCILPTQYIQKYCTVK